MWSWSLLVSKCVIACLCILLSATRQPVSQLLLDVLESCPSSEVDSVAERSTELGHELITTDKKPFQRYWASAVYEALCCYLKSGAPPSRLARILTDAQRHLGDRITVYRIAQVGIRLDDESQRISIALRVGLNICLANQCRCGATVQSEGLHPLSCRLSAGRFPRISAINIIKKSLDTAGLHSILEPVGLDRDDGRRPDGVTSFSFKGGKALAWDATCTDSFSTSHLCSTILNPGSESSAAEDLKRRKYSQLVADFEFVPVAVETSGIIGSAGCSLLTDIGRRITRATNDLRKMSYIFQQISVAIIRGNAQAMTASSRKYGQELVQRR